MWLTTGAVTLLHRSGSLSMVRRSSRSLKIQRAHLCGADRCDPRCRCARAGRPTPAPLRAPACGRRTVRARRIPTRTCSSLYDVSMSAAFFQKSWKPSVLAERRLRDLRARILEQSRAPFAIRHQRLKRLRQPGGGAALRHDAVAPRTPPSVVVASCGQPPEARGPPPCPRGLPLSRAIRAADPATACRIPARCSSAIGSSLGRVGARDEVDDAPQHAQQGRRLRAHARAAAAFERERRTR